MLFKDYHIPMIRSGSKTVTRREWDENYVRPNEGSVQIASDEMFTSDEEADCYIRILDVYDQALGEMTDEDARKEGDYEDMDDFREGYAKVYGDDAWDPEKVVAVVEFEYVGRERPETDPEQKQLVTDGGEEVGRATHRPPRDDLAGMSPYSNHLALERRVCPNCRYYFDVDKDSDDVFCSDACRNRHEDGVLLADGGRVTSHWDLHCSRCGDEYPADRENALCESCVKSIQMSKLMDGVLCERCDGEGWIYGTWCDLERAMNGRDTRCPECHGTGRVAWEPDLDDVHPDLRSEVKARA